MSETLLADGVSWDSMGHNAWFRVNESGILIIMIKDRQYILNPVEVESAPKTTNSTQYA